jgi:hypothetical protein
MNAQPFRPAVSSAARRSKRRPPGASRPEAKSDQNAQRNYERYLALARAEALSGNTVGAENYYPDWLSFGRRKEMGAAKMDLHH